MFREKYSSENKQELFSIYQEEKEKKEDYIINSIIAKVKILYEEEKILDILEKEIKKNLIEK